jgi:hypothetical protein
MTANPSEVETAIAYARQFLGRGRVNIPFDHRAEAIEWLAAAASHRGGEAKLLSETDVIRKMVRLAKTAAADADTEQHSVPF